MAKKTSSPAITTKPKIVKDINDDGFTIGKQIKNIGVVPNPNTHLCKYIKVDYAKNWISDDMIRFDEPTRWNDKYESRFYTATYKNNKDKETSPLYALSLTTNKQSEASWLVYSDAKPDKCVRFVFSVSKLRHMLENIPSPGGIFYIGEVNYDLTDSNIIHLNEDKIDQTIPGGTKQIPNILYDEVFSDFKFHKYLSLLLIKRKLFDYEGEVRVFYVPDKGSMTRQLSPGQYKEFKGISLKDALVSIDLQQTMDKADKDFFENWAFTNGIKFKEYDLYGSNDIITIP